MSESETSNPTLVRVHAILSPEIVERIDDYRFEHRVKFGSARRVPSRSAAMRDLILRGLDAAEGKSAEPAKGTRAKP